MSEINIIKLKEKYNDYLKFKKSDNYDEQYKFDFFKNNKIDFSKSNDFIKDFKEIRKQAINLIPRNIRDNLLIHLGLYHNDILKKMLNDLYNEKNKLSDRINNFENKINKIIQNDDKWTQKGFGKIGFGSSSFILALYDYKKYFFINPITPFNEFIKEFNLDKDLYKKGDNGTRYVNWLNLVKDTIIPELSKIDKNISLLNVQDFIFCGFGGYKKDEIIEENNNNKSYWIYSPGENASKWDEFYEKGIMALGWDELGNLNQYKSKKEITEKLQELYNTDSSKKNDSTANYDFLKNIHIGDIIIAKKGKYKYIGYGIVEGNYEFQENNNGFGSIRKVKWIKKGEWEEVDMGGIVLKTLTDITKYPDYVKKLKTLLGINTSNNIINIKKWIQFLNYWILKSK